MKKYFITLMLALVCIFALVLSLGAEEYTVSSNSEYQAAYENAVNGDTIIISGKLTCDIQATKSITYILNGDWESSKLVVDRSNVEVSFIADGGDYKIMPTGYSNDGWLRLTEIYENVVINLGGKNGGTVTIDGTNATQERVSVSVASNTPDITWNFFDGSAIANFNPQTKNTEGNAFIIFAKTINMYEGSKIYANCIINEPLIRATYFNLFGGEIFGNVLESKKVSNTGSGAIFVSERIMIYGGSIYKNIFNAKATGVQNNMIGFFTTPAKKDTVVLDLQIGDTYVTGNGSNEISAMFGTTNNQFNSANFYYNSAMQKGTRYKFTDTPVLKYDEATGKTIWQVSNYSVQSQSWNGRSWTHTECPGNGVAVFLDAEKKVINGNVFDAYTLINAYIDGVYSYKGATNIAIPGGYDSWSMSGREYCHDGREYTLNEITSSLPITLYAAYNAGNITSDVSIVCAGGCGKTFVCFNPEHNLQVVSISYTDYSKFGIKEIKCNTCDLDETVEFSAPALFACLGYSSQMYGTSGIAIGYTVNDEAIAEYTEATGKTLKYGVFAVSKDKLGTNDVFGKDGTASDGVINAEITSYEFAAFELKIIGFTNEYKDLKLAMGAYVTVKDGETTEYSYVQDNTKGELMGKYYFASYNDIVD